MAGHLLRVLRNHRRAAHDAAFGHAHVILDQGGVWAGASDPRALTGAATGWPSGTL